MAKLIEHSTVETSRGLRTFRSYQSPSAQLGIPLCADLWFDTQLTADEMLQDYKNQLLWLHNTMRDLDFPYYPVIDPICRLKSASGYYFYDICDFTHTYKEFIEQSRVDVSLYFSPNPSLERLRMKQVLSTTELDCTIEYWKDNCKVKILESNLYHDMLGTVIKWITRSNGAYTKAVLKWGDKTISFESNQFYHIPPTDGIHPPYPLEDFFSQLILPRESN
jgi:hypothetical protein